MGQLNPEAIITSAIQCRLCLTPEKSHGNPQP